MKDTSSYNEEPVYYCTDCLSLRIKTVAGLDFCEHCGATRISTSNIEEWEKLYKSTYGFKYLEQ